MRPVIERVVSNLPCPDDRLLTIARRNGAARETYHELLGRIEAFRVLEKSEPAPPLPWPGRLRIAAFNAQRLKRPRAVRSLLQEAGAQVALLSEADIGMARSGNVHTVREMIGSSGMGHLYGVEYVELDLGDEREIKRHAGERNACGLHGNAIVTGLELAEPCLIPLEESGFWFQGWHGAQRRIGGRMALAARIAAAPRPLWLVGTHLESKTDPDDRRSQIQALLRALNAIAPGEACVIGGDFNTKALPKEGSARESLLKSPERYEPLFTDLQDAGFEWIGSNVACPTQRAGPNREPQPPFAKLDWLMTRGVRVENAMVIPALDDEGEPISDHDMVAADIVL